MSFKLFFGDKIFFGTILENVWREVDVTDLADAEMEEVADRVDTLENIFLVSWTALWVKVADACLLIPRSESFLDTPVLAAYCLPSFRLLQRNPDRGMIVKLISRLGSSEPGMKSKGRLISDLDYNVTGNNELYV